jgi:hypothetical protein
VTLQGPYGLTAGKDWHFKFSRGEALPPRPEGRGFRAVKMMNEEPLTLNTFGKVLKGYFPDAEEEYKGFGYFGDLAEGHANTGILISR